MATASVGTNETGPWSERSLAGKRRVWQELTALLDRVDASGLSRLSKEELRTLGRLHRRAASHLAQARSGRRDTTLISYLNALVLRSHSVVYRSRGKSRGKSALHFVVHGFPAACQRSRAFIGVAALIFGGFVVASLLATYSDPRAASVFVPDFIYQQTSPEVFSETGPAGGMPEGLKPVFAADVIWNNIKVGFYCFGGGIILGIPTLLVLVTNGFMVGGMAGQCHQFGTAVGFWSYILPHGVLELPCIVISAGAGLQLTWAIVAPGRHTRKDAITLAGREAVQIALGIVPLLIVAGVIESFVSPEDLPAATKFTVAALVGSVALLYFLVPREEGRLSTEEAAKAEGQSGSPQKSVPARPVPAIR